MAVESRLCVEGLLAAGHGALELLRLTVNGLYVHQEVVADTEASSTLFAHERCLLRVTLDVSAKLVRRGKSPGATVKGTLVL
jgi:hypothetical protein